MGDLRPRGRYRVCTHTRSAGGLFELEVTTTWTIVDQRTREVVRTFTGQSDASYSTDGTGWEEATYSGVQGVSIDASGEVALVDHGEGRIERVPLPK